MSKGRIVFVSGTGTGVGKTVVTGLLAKEMLDAGTDVITVKMVQTGCDGFSEDLEVHRKMMGGVRFAEDERGLTAPQIFTYPASAELAARLEGKKVDVGRIVAAVDECAANHDVVLVESAGGLMVPLDEETLTIDVAAREKWPLILVTNGTLGSINHTILSLEAALSRDMEIESVVYDWAPGVPPEIDEDTPAAIRRWLKNHNCGDCLRIIPRASCEPQNHQTTKPSNHQTIKPSNSLSYDREHIWHPYASLKNPPPVRLAVASEGTDIITSDGKRLVDAVSSWWCMAHGHNHPKITEAIRRQSEILPHVMFGGFTHEPAIRLAQKLAAFAPTGLDRVFFADSGSIAVEVAVKMATQYQHAKGRLRRTKMLALKGGYHGDTACAMALSDPDGMHTLFAGMMPKHFFAPKPGGVSSLQFAVCSEENGERANATVVNNEQTNMDSFIAALRDVVAKHRDEIAGMICEPILQAANAMNIYSPDVLREMRRIADENDFVLVFDEIATGFYRTGPRWACEYAGVVPDVMTVGKALTGGHITLAATLASEKIADAISNGSPSAFMHGPTYMANPLACAAACASLQLFAECDYSAKVRRIEELLRDGLAPAKTLPNVSGVRVIGAVGIIEVHRLPARDDIERVIDEHGVWLRPFANFIYTMPPLVSVEAAIRRIVAAMLDLAACPPGPETGDGDFHE